MDVTILIPTLNRSFFIDKLLTYYEKFNFLGKIIIIDSSSQEELNINKSRVEKSRLNITHLPLISDEFYAMAKGIELIGTEYAIHSGDDDYFSVSGIKKLINYLEKNKNFISAGGKSITVSYNSNSKIIKGSAFYNLPIKNQVKAVDRLKSIKRYEQLPVYVIYRSSIIKKIYHNLHTNQEFSINYRRNFNEYLWRLLPPILGQGKLFNKIFFLVRFQTDQKYIRKELSDIRDDGFNKIYKKSLKNLKAVSSAENKGNKIYEISKKIFKSFVAGQLQSNCFIRFQKKLYLIKFICIYLMNRVANKGKKIHNYYTHKMSPYYEEELDFILNLLVKKK